MKGEIMDMKFLEEKFITLCVEAERIGLDIKDRVEKIEAIQVREMTDRNFLKFRRAVLSLNQDVGPLLEIEKNIKNPAKGFKPTRSFEQIVCDANSGLI